MTTVVPVVAILVVALVGPRAIWSRAHAALGASREWWQRAWTPRLMFREDNTVVVPIPLSMSMFTSLYGTWHQLGPAHSARLDERGDGTYQLAIATLPITAPAELEALEPPVRATIAASIDLLHAVDELDDPPIGILERAHLLREAVGDHFGI